MAYDVQAACLLLALANLVVRTWRTQLLFHGLGHRVPFTEIATANLAGDAAAALTPMRLGGLPAQVAFFRRVGVRPSVSIPALLVESIVLYPVYGAIAIGLGAWAGQAWIAQLRTAMTDAGDSMRAILAILGVGWGLLYLFRRLAPNRSHAVRESFRDGLRLVRGMSPLAVLGTVPLTVADVATRLALLPLLARDVPGAPGVSVLAVASFAMLYGQIAMPTPGGAGIVDLGMLRGAAGNFGAASTGILFWWRFWTAGAHIGAAVPALWWRVRRASARGAIPAA
jgi:uncharacterized membrane protein YbhN (UPF0104 family)